LNYEGGMRVSAQGILVAGSNNIGKGVFATSRAALLVPESPSNSLALWGMVGSATPAPSRIPRTNRLQLLRRHSKMDEAPKPTPDKA